MVAIFVLLLATNAANAQRDAADQIAAIEARLGGRIGVAGLDTGNGKRIDYRAEERFPLCSTFKFLAAAAVLKRVDEKKDKLDRFVSYDAKDILEYAPVTKAHLGNGGMTLGALCAAAIEQSDNTGGNLLLEAIGGPVGLTNFARDLGDRMTRLDRKEPELNSAIPGDDRDTTTPASMLGDIRQLLVGNTLSASSRQQLQEWLQAKRDRRCNDSCRDPHQLDCWRQDRTWRKRRDERCCNRPSAGSCADRAGDLLRRINSERERSSGSCCRGGKGCGRILR